MIRALIVDDEPLAREGLTLRLAGHADIAIIGEAGDGQEAVRQILALEPDVVFLDVQMPGLDGFGVLRAVAGRHLPRIVFVTAHDRHALAAFDAHALDYLLKPVSDERFADALRRVREKRTRDAAPADAEKLARLVDALEDGAAASPVRRFAVREGRRVLLLPAAEVDWIRAQANYAELHARGRAWLVRTTLHDLERRLDPVAFARIHRSLIVRLDAVRDLHPGPHGDWDVRLNDGTLLRMSRTYRERVLRPDSPAR
jgi:two-component system LytT family response regulator